MKLYSGKYHRFKRSRKGRQEKSNWVNFSKTFFDQNYLDWFIVMLHTHMMLSYRWSLTYDRNYLFMHLFCFYLESDQSCECLILVIKDKVVIFKCYPTRLKRFPWRQNLHFCHCHLDIPIYTFYFFCVFQVIGTSANEFNGDLKKKLIRWLSNGKSVI